jgi:hypothetical protein
MEIASNGCGCNGFGASVVEKEGLRNKQTKQRADLLTERTSL